MPELLYAPFSEFKKLRDAADRFESAGIFADLCRVNALFMIMRAGSGHIGTSFSSIDIVSWLYLHELRVPRTREEWARGEHDICFSSKGHDAPAFYAVLVGLGLLEEDLLRRLRRLGGLPGHPDIGTPFIEANTGSLGMGISKAKGMLLAARLKRKPRRAFVLTGDGEWQEGQMWEAMLSAAHAQLGELTVVVDHNKLQSDTRVESVSPLGDLEKKFESFGWRVFRCDGHDLASFSGALAESGRETRKPKILIADTVKGKGVSFMEGPAMKPGERLYGFHSGAPTLDAYEKAFLELRDRITKRMRALGLPPAKFEAVAFPAPPAASKVRSLVDEYAEILAEAGTKHKNLVVLDADLAKDCGLLLFEKRFPERFIECGIAEQDMVSQAGGMALQGYLPAVHSFASFLTARANEQIFSNATEKTRIIYVGALAGLLPAGPGHSHQATRDIAAVGAVPGLDLVQPCCRLELEAVFSWAIEVNPGSTYLRLSNTALEAPFRLPENYRPERGKGVSLCSGKDGVLIAYGPVMLAEAWNACRILREKFGIELELVNLPWLNVVDRDWLRATVESRRRVFTLDDHDVGSGQGRMLAAEMACLGLAAEVSCRGVRGIPLCGSNREVLTAHRLDAESIVQDIAGQYQKAALFYAAE